MVPIIITWALLHELGQTPRDGEEKGSLECCSPWGREESDRTGDWTTATKLLLLSWPWLECKWQKSALNIHPTDSNPVVYNTPQVIELTKSLFRFFYKKNKLFGQPNKFLVYWPTTEIVLVWVRWVEWKLLSHIWLFLAPWTVSCQALLSMKFFRPEYWRE